jgi:hypothetical protein
MPSPFRVVWQLQYLGMRPAFRAGVNGDHRRLGHDTFGHTGERAAENQHKKELDLAEEKGAIGATRRDRTGDLLITKPPVSSPMFRFRFFSLLVAQPMDCATQARQELEPTTKRQLGAFVSTSFRNNKVGGVSVHSGTIPSKTVRDAVLYLPAFNESILRARLPSSRADQERRDRQSRADDRHARDPFDSIAVVRLDESDALQQKVLPTSGVVHCRGVLCSEKNHAIRL